MHLSLAQVAGDAYSTSLISQIERNKIEPSLSSLRYLAEKLNLPYDELAAMSQQLRATEAEASSYQHLEEARTVAAALLESNRPKDALPLLEQLTIAQIPTSLRWRMIALRGQCYFAQRRFIAAQKDFVAALDFIPGRVPQEQQLDAILLRLHLAATSRELGQYDIAYEQYSSARLLMSTSTPLRYLAEAHWGISLVLYEQAYKSDDGNEHQQEGSNDEQKEEQHSPIFRAHMEHALKHAERAGALYDSADELLRANLLNCQIALIEQSLGRLDSAQKRLQNLLNQWQPTLGVQEANLPIEIVDKKFRYNERERANLVSAAACYLASVEMEAHKCHEALAHIDLALEVGKHTYILRRADAYMMKGQILAESNDPAAVEAFQLALKELKDTDRLGAKTRIHRLLGAYLIRLGKQKEGDLELDKAMQLANVPTQFNTTASNEISTSTYQEG